MNSPIQWFLPFREAAALQPTLTTMNRHKQPQSTGPMARISFTVRIAARDPIKIRDIPARAPITQGAPLAHTSIYITSTADNDTLVVTADETGR